MNFKKVATVSLLGAALGFLLTGCGDDSPPLEKEINQIHEAENSVDKLNDLTKDSQDQLDEQLGN